LAGVSGEDYFEPGNLWDEEWERKEGGEGVGCEVSVELLLLKSSPSVCARVLLGSAV